MLGAVSASAHRGLWSWSERKVVNTLAGRAIKVEGKRVPLERPTLVCWGEGPGVVRRGMRRWKHFRCIQPTFFPSPGVLAGPDALFRVHIVGERRFVISNRRFAR